MRAAKMILCALWVLCAAPGWSQRHLPHLHIFSTTEAVRLDTYVEHPAINNGMGIADMPLRGKNLTFQIFVPHAGGLAAFESTVTLNNPNLNRTFRIVSVKDWQQRDMTGIANPAAHTFHAGRLSFAPLPPSGHIATVALEPIENALKMKTLQVACTVTIVSIPPRRVWQMTGSQPLPLR